MTNHLDRSGHPLLPDHPGILELDKSPGSPPARRGSLPGLAEAEIVISECNIDKKRLRCTNHDCGVEKIKVRSKKWGWIPRKSEYGYSNSQSTKYLCKVKRLGISAHRISTSIDNPEPLPVGLVGLIVGTRGGGENNGDESESSGMGTQWTEMSCYDGDGNQVDLKSA